MFINYINENISCKFLFIMKIKYRTFLKQNHQSSNKITNEYEIIFSLDPSKDRTEEKLNLASKNKNIKIISLSRRFGQPALLLLVLIILLGLLYCY